MISVPRRDTALDRLALIRDVLTSLPAAVAYLAGPDLIIDFANDAYCRLAGDRDVVGVPLCQALPELADQGRLDLLERIMQTGEPVRGTETGVLLQQRGGQAGQLFVDFSYHAVRDGDGAIAGVLLHAADVAAHPRDRDPLEALEALEALAGNRTSSEERYRTLFETMPQGVVHYGADGSIIGVNPAASEILGMDLSTARSWPVVPEGQAMREDGSPFPPEDLPVRVALRTGEIVTDVVAGVRHGGTGELRWVRITAVPDARDAQGRPSRAYAIFTDLTEQRRTEAALRQSTTLLGRLREANVLGVVVVGEHRVYEANDAYLAIIGYSRDDLEAGRIAWRKITPRQWASAEDKAMEQLRRTGACQPFEKEYVHQDGHRVPVLIGAAVLDRNPLRWASFVVDLTARQRAEQERAELLASARTARAEADSTREQLDFLLRAGALVAATRDRDELLDHVAQLVVPSLADYCVVFLPTADGMLCASALTHADPARATMLARLREHPISPAGPLLPQRAYTTGTTQLTPDVAAEMPAWARAEPDMISIVKLMHPQSAIGTPLLAAQGPLGVMVLGRGAGRPRFAGSDVEMVEELARRLAVGLANADTFAREHAIAETLQRSLLPGALPQIPGLDPAVRYLPATEGADVGGDWYDAFPLAGGRAGLVTGDVAGHNIASASIMGQVRSLLRGYAIDNLDPARVLRRTNTAVAQLLPDVLASVVYAVLEPATGDLTYANAGHPPPLIATSTGHAEFLNDTAGTMLGACTDARFTTGHRQLRPGAALLCYTDGLIEDRRRDISDGLTILAETLQRSGPSPAGKRAPPCRRPSSAPQGATTTCASWQPGYPLSAHRPPRPRSHIPARTSASHRPEQRPQP